MIENEKLNLYQFFVLVFTFTIGNTIINAPSLIVSHAKQDAWIAGIMALSFGILTVFLYINLIKRYPNKTIIEFMEILLGKIIGKVVSVLFIFYLFILASLMSRQLSDFVITFLLPETPLFYIEFLFVCIVIMGTFLGLPTLGRSGEILFPFLILLLSFLLLMLTKEKELANLLPMLENGFNPVIRGTIASIGIPYLQIVCFLMVHPHIEEGKTKKITLSFFLGVFLAGIFIVLSVLHSLLILGTILTEHKQYPIYFLAQKISIGDIIQRIEVFLAIIWFITIFFKTTLLFYGAFLGINQLFNIKNSKLLIFPLGLLFFITSRNISPNIVFFDEFFNFTFPTFSLIFGFIIPLILLILSYFKMAL